MADNESTGTGKAVATDKVTYSGDADQNVQLVRVVQVTGAEGSKTVVDLPGDATNGLKVNATKLTPDGTNTMPSGDTVGRAIFVKPTDGTTVPDVATSGSDAQSNTSNRLSVGARANVYNGTTWDRMRGDTNGTYQQGNVAHDGADAGNPVKVGARAINYANQTAVANNDRSDLYCDRHGSLFTLGGHPDCVTIEAAYTAAQTDTAIVTVATGSRIVVTQAQVLTDQANTAFPQVRIGFGTVNTPTTTGVVLTHPGLPAGGGVSRGDGSGIIGIGADDADLRITCGAPTGGSLRVLITYHTIPG